jgi:hypothetical protein
VLLVQPDSERRIEWAPQTAAFVEEQRSPLSSPLLVRSIVDTLASRRKRCLWFTYNWEFGAGGARWPATAA